MSDLSENNNKTSNEIPEKSVTIESELFALIVKKSKKKWAMGITCFPFRELGTVEDYKGSKGIG